MNRAQWRMIEEAIVTADEAKASEMIRRANEEHQQQSRAEHGREPTRKIVVVDQYSDNVPIDSDQPWLIRTRPI